MREYRKTEKSREYCKKYHREYRKNHPELSRKSKDSFRFSGNKQAAVARDVYKCIECGMNNDEHLEVFGRDLNMHHIDGSGSSDCVNNKLDNLQTMCVRCHAHLHAVKRWGRK